MDQEQQELYNLVGGYGKQNIFGGDLKSMLL
jgi:hypothetical protein